MLLPFRGTCPDCPCRLSVHGVSEALPTDVPTAAHAARHAAHPARYDLQLAARSLWSDKILPATATLIGVTTDCDFRGSKRPAVYAGALLCSQRVDSDSPHAPNRSRILWTRLFVETRAEFELRLRAIFIKGAWPSSEVWPSLALVRRHCDVAQACETASATMPSGQRSWH